MVFCCIGCFCLEVLFVCMVGSVVVALLRGGGLLTITLVVLFCGVYMFLLRFCFANTVVCVSVFVFVGFGLLDCFVCVELFGSLYLFGFGILVLQFCFTVVYLNL